jgi:hypothetical protein
MQFRIQNPSLETRTKISISFLKVDLLKMNKSLKLKFLTFLTHQSHQKEKAKKIKDLLQKISNKNSKRMPKLKTINKTL